MTKKATTTTPDPELSTPLGTEPGQAPQGGAGRGEVAGCPTGLNGLDQAAQAQRPGGGGSPGTGDTEADRDNL
jgi:hypothetical protein